MKRWNATQQTTRWLNNSGLSATIGRASEPASPNTTWVSRLHYQSDRCGDINVVVGVLKDWGELWRRTAHVYREGNKIGKWSYSHFLFWMLDFPWREKWVQLRHQRISTWKFSGTGTRGTATDSAFRISIWKGGRKFFWQCFACLKLGNASRTRVASKNREVLQKAGRSQYWL